jgi:hypothetical protein
MIDPWVAEVASTVAETLRAKRASGYVAADNTQSSDADSADVSSIGDAVDQQSKIDEVDDPARQPDGRSIQTYGLPDPPTDFQPVPIIAPLTQLPPEPQKAAAMEPEIIKRLFAGENPHAKVKVAVAAAAEGTTAPSRSFLAGVPSLIATASQAKTANLMGQPQFGMPYGSPYYPGMGMPYYRPMMGGYGAHLGMYGPGMAYGGYGAPMAYGGYNPIAVGLASTAMQGGTASNQGELASRLQDARQQLEEAQTRMDERTRALHDGQGAPVSTAQLATLRDAVLSAAQATGTNRDFDTIYDPVSQQSIQAHFGGPGTTLFGGGEQVGFLDWLMGRRTSPAWVAYQQARARYEAQAQRYENWRQQQTKNVQDMRSSPFSITGATQQLQRIRAEDDADRARRREIQQQTWQTQQNALRNMAGSGHMGGMPQPTTGTGLPLPPASPHAPVSSLGSPHASAHPASMPGREVSAAISPEFMRRFLGDAAKRILVTGSAGGLVGGVSGALNARDGNYLDAISKGTASGLRSGLSLGVGGELGAAAGSGVSSLRGNDFPGTASDRTIGRVFGTLAGAAADPSIRSAISPAEVKSRSLLSRLGLTNG